MTADTAIRVLGEILEFVKPIDPPEEHDAINLGIEALKEIKSLRLIHALDMTTPLPGETEE